MIAFMKNDEFNLVKKQVNKIVNAKNSVNDPAVLKAVISLAWEEVQQAFPNMNEEEATLLQQIKDICDRASAEKLFIELSQYVIPFQPLTEVQLKKLFPKVKKIKLPHLAPEDFHTMSYLAWDEQGSQYRMMVAPFEQRIIGLRGTFQPLQQKGLCHICHRFTEIGMFVVETKGEIAGTFKKRGNTVCMDMKQCNQQVETLAHLSELIHQLKGK